jgi:phosphoribosylaminoimidazolecarboxamide formyltransferase / IMP cyclohydrolase
MTTKNALISVYNKDGIIPFVEGLKKLGYTLYSSGGTANKIKEAGIEVHDVAELVGGGAILGHKVVTLSREISAGILADPTNEKEMKEMETLGLPIIDLVCVDCYPLAEALTMADVKREFVLEKTDIGGPTMLRAAAKGRRIVLCDVADRPKVIEWLEAGKPDEDKFIAALVAKAEMYVANYALMSARYHGEGTYYGMMGEKIDQPRYGENPWQKSLGLFKAFGENTDPLSIDKFKVIVGNPGHVNWTDLDRTLQTITHIAAAAYKNLQYPTRSYFAVGAKHGNPCGAAIGGTPKVTLENMLDGNLLSIFGGVVITDFAITEELAEVLRNYHSSTKRLLDMIIAPSVTPEEIDILGRKDDACKIVVNPALEALQGDCMSTEILLRPVRGGFLAQENYSFVLDLSSNDVECTKGRYSKTDLVLAWAVNATSNSNTITLVKDCMLIGNGVGQQDRKECCELAVKRAQDADHDTNGATVCSDSFFPFSDGPKVLIDAGIATILTTSGSIRDEMVFRQIEDNDVCLWTIPNKLGRGFYGH